jgi:hypothetical protein
MQAAAITTRDDPNRRQLSARHKLAQQSEAHLGSKFGRPVEWNHRDKNLEINPANIRETEEKGMSLDTFALVRAHRFPPVRHLALVFEHALTLLRVRRSPFRQAVMLAISEWEMS